MRLTNFQTLCNDIYLLQNIDYIQKLIHHHVEGVSYNSLIVDTTAQIYFPAPVFSRI